MIMPLRPPPSDARRPPVVCFPFVGDVVGGSHISALHLVKNLPERGYTPLVVLHDDTQELAPYLTARGISYVLGPQPDRSSAGRVPSQIRRILAMASLVRRAKAFLVANDVDIVHTNDGRIHATWGPAAALAGRKLVWHHRGDPAARGANLLAPLIADRMLVVSDFSRPRRPLRAFADRIAVVRSPFVQPRAVPDRREARRAIAAELGLGPDARFVGFFGFLIDRKRPVTFVDIVDRYRRTHSDDAVHGLIFGGSMPGATEVEDAVRRRIDELGCGAFVHMMGFRQCVDPLFAAIDALLVPAVHEPFGRTLIEAMLLGTPVIATADGGNVEAIDSGRNGLLVPVGDVDAFVAALRSILGDRAEWERISATAAEEARRTYSVERHVDSVAEVYRALLAERSARSHRVAKLLRARIIPR